jgi:ribosome biogenesis GTPase / thiamine phosphate phosphatase
MKLEELGYHNQMEANGYNHTPGGFEPARVVAEHRERYVVRTEKGEYDAEITGHMRFTAKGREDFPAVCDWVEVTIFESDLAIIHRILPRASMISRKAAGQSGEIQVIAANIDFALLVQSVERDFNLNRLERYLTICYSSNVSPVIVLTKTDLISGSRLDELTESIQLRIKNVPVIAISNETREGLSALSDFIEKGSTYCMLGSSGVGKSTLLNNLAGKTIMQTGSISPDTKKGRHVTTHRELFVIENGGILIDNPGMREVGIADAPGGLEAAFDTIADLSNHCRYKDCTHTGEAGCSVTEAVEKGEIDAGSYENYLKMAREKEHFESSVAEKRQKDKSFGKMVKNFKKIKSKNQYE